MSLWVDKVGLYPRSRKKRSDLATLAESISIGPAAWMTCITIMAFQIGSSRSYVF